MTRPSKTDLPASRGRARVGAGPRLLRAAGTVLSVGFFVGADAGAQTGDHETLLSAAFEQGSAGFEYVDDAFLGTNNPQAAAGRWREEPTRRTGALFVALGDGESQLVEGLSGAWLRTFEVDRRINDVEIDLTYRLEHAAGFEPDEFGQVMVRLDDRWVPGAGPTFVERLVGDGDEGEVQSTGLRRFVSREGRLEPGRHVLGVGVYLNKKTAADEWSRLWIEEVRVLGRPEPRCRRRVDCDDGNPCTDDLCREGVCRYRAAGGLCRDGFDYSEGE